MPGQNITMTKKPKGNNSNSNNNGNNVNNTSQKLSEVKMSHNKKHKDNKKEKSKSGPLKKELKSEQINNEVHEKKREAKSNNINNKNEKKKNFSDKKTTKTITTIPSQNKNSNFNSTIPVKYKTGRDILFQEIQQFGGSMEDLELLEDVLSGSEIEEDIEGNEKGKTNSKKGEQQPASKKSKEKKDLSNKNNNLDNDSEEVLLGFLPFYLFIGPFDYFSVSISVFFCFYKYIYIIFKNLINLIGPLNIYTNSLYYITVNFKGTQGIHVQRFEFKSF